MVHRTKNPKDIIRMVWVQWTTSEFIRELEHITPEEKQREDKVKRRDLPELSTKGELEPDLSDLSEQEVLVMA